MFPNRLLHGSLLLNKLAVLSLMSSSLITNSFAVLIWSLIMEKTASPTTQLRTAPPMSSSLFSTLVSPLSRSPITQLSQNGILRLLGELRGDEWGNHLVVGLHHWLYLPNVVSR